MITLTTPEQIEAFRLLTIRGALKMELAGMRHSKGFNASRVLKSQYGIRGHREEQLVKLEALIKELTE